jgi:DNA-binding NarL/FixJ family response regulator
VKFIQDCKAACPTAKILVLTACNTEEHIREALNAGATGYVLKDSGSADLINGILEVANGGLYVCSTVWSKIVNRFLTGNNHFEMPALRGESDLTGREFQILKVIARGYSNKEISRELKISVKTVEKHRSNLMRKLDLHNTASVTMFAIKNGLLQANEVFSKR